MNAAKTDRTLPEWPACWRWPLVAARVFLIFLLFTGALIAHLLFISIGKRHVIPSVFLVAMAWLVGLRINIVGRIANEPLLLVANHVSWLDIFALAKAARTAFVAKDELASNRVIRWLCQQNDTLFVPREQRASAPAQAARLRKALLYRRMTIFPEGTTSDGVHLLPFKSSLLSAAVQADGAEHPASVQPVALIYEHPAEIAWHGRESGAANMLRILARIKPVRLTIRFLSPLAPDDLTDRKVITKAAENAIAAELAL